MGHSSCAKLNATLATNGNLRFIYKSPSFGYRFALGDHEEMGHVSCTKLNANLTTNGNARFFVEIHVSLSLPLSLMNGTSLLITEKRWPSFLYSGQEILADGMETIKAELTTLLSLVSLHI